MSKSHNLPPRFLSTNEAARFLCLSPRTLEKHRSHGTGPMYRKLGGRIVYSIDDLESWADKGLRSSTSEHNEDVIPPASTSHAKRKPKNE